MTRELKGQLGPFTNPFLLPSSQTLKYRSRSTVILNRFELLNRELTAKMAAQDQGVAPAGQGGEDRALGVSKDKTSASQVDVADAAVGQGAVGGAGGVGGSGQAASNSKKKKKKKGGNK